MGAVMDHHSAPSSDIQILQIIGETIISFALLHNTIIFIYHACNTTKAINQDGSSVKFSRVIFISLLSILLMVLSNITNILSTFSLIPPSIISCCWQINIQLFAYIYSKICLYVLFLERLFSVFIGSDLKFTKPQMITFRIYLFLLLLFYTTMIYIFSNGEYNPNLHGCVFNHPFWLNIIAAICDFSTILTILILFSRRLWILSHRITDDINCKMSFHANNHSNTRSSTTLSSSAIATNSNSINSTTINRLPLRNIESNSVSTVQHMVRSSIQSLANISNRLSSHNIAKWKADEDLLCVLRKTTILNIIAVLSTLFSMILCCFIFPTLWISIDSIINCWSILLMFKWYENIYFFICEEISTKLSDECLSCCSCHCFCSVIDTTSNEIVVVSVKDIAEGNEDEHENVNDGVGNDIGDDDDDKNVEIDTNLKIMDINIVQSHSNSGSVVKDQDGTVILNHDNDFEIS